MDTVVVITARDPKDCPALSTLRAAGLRARHRRLDLNPAEVALERADMLLIDVPDDRRVEPLVRPYCQAPGMEETPTVLMVGPAGLGDLPGLHVPGVVDFVLAPPNPEELLARVRRTLRAHHRTGDPARVVVGDLIVDLEGYEVIRRRQALDLTYKEFELLKFLLTHEGRAFTRDELLARVWGYDYYGGSRTVDIHIRRIRAKLQHPYDGYIKTIRHVGYKWLAAPPAGRQPQPPPNDTAPKGTTPSPDPTAETTT